MSYDRKFLRLSFEFHALNSVEVAETGCLLTGGPTFDAAAALSDPTDADLQSFATALGTVMNGGALVWADYSVLESVKLAAVDTSGHYITAARQVPTAS
ncbi:MAG: hypothetical protein ACOYBX_16760, partial [Mycobacterium sp.]